MNYRNEQPRETMYRSRGNLKIMVFVTHRTKNMVYYHMGNDTEAVYEKPSKVFDSIYSVSR